MSISTRSSYSDYLKDNIIDRQKMICILLYISLISHGLDIYLANVGFLERLIPTLQLISAVSAAVFFILECLFLPPMGILIMAIAATLLSMGIPYFIAFLVQSIIESVILMAIGGIIAALSIGVIVTVVNGVIVSAVVAPLVITPFLAGAAAVGVTTVAGAGVTAGVDAGLNEIHQIGMFRLHHVLINLLLVVLLVWPALTWTSVFQGVFALKPVCLAQQYYLSFSEEKESENYRRFFDSEQGKNYTLNGVSGWTFGDGFYSSYIYSSRNTFAQGTTPAAANDTCITFGLNGIVYMVDIAANEIYQTTAYTLKQKDAIVLVGHEAFLFGNNKIALLGPNGRYLWKDTKWTSDFDALSSEEQYNRLYAILEEQNDGQPGAISIEDVAVVAYAQRNGKLLYYDTVNHRAYFGWEDKNGEITILCQDGHNTRTEATTFTPVCDSDNLPYTMLDADVVAYIDKNSIVFQGVNSTWKTAHYIRNSYNGEKNPFIAFHVLHDEDGNEYYAYQARENVICLERMDSFVIEVPFDTSKYDAIYSVGDYIYCIVYDSDNNLNKFTYIQDLKEDESLTEVWTEKWSFERLRLHSGLWADDENVTQKESNIADHCPIPSEGPSFADRYPVPELRTSAKQIGLYRDNLIMTSRYFSYQGPVEQFRFKFPSVLYEETQYTYNEDGTEVQVALYCQNDPSTLIVTLRPNADGTAPDILLDTLQKNAEEGMINVKVIRSGSIDQGTAATFYLTGNAAHNTELIFTRLCRIDSEYIMEMDLLMPNAVSKEDQAYKDFYAEAMFACCGFGSDEEPPLWKKFKAKSKYGL